MSLDHDANTEKDGFRSRRIHLREISGDSETPLETVGQDLRAARLRRGDEIAQVSRALKIRKDHLEALEEDRLEDLPGKTYAIGFVRSYARHLGLDATAYVDRFKQEISGRSDEQVREPAPIHQDERSLPQGWRIIAGVVVVLLGYGIWHLVSPSGDSAQQTPPAPVLGTPKPKPAPAPQPVVAPEQSATPSPATDSVPPAGTINGTGQEASALPPPAAGARTPATSMAPVQTASPTAAPGQQAQQVARPGAPQAAVPAVPPAAGATPGQSFGNGGGRVVLRARGDTRVTVKGPDGTILLNRDLKAGDSYSAPNVPGVTFATSNAGAVEVNLDGIALGRAGQSQQILGRVSLDPQSLTDRFNNR